MPREILKTREGELMLGWPADPDTDSYVQLGIRYQDHSAWIPLTSAGQVADLRAQLQRASRRVWPEQPGRFKRGETRACMNRAVHEPHAWVWHGTHPSHCPGIAANEGTA